MRTSDSEMLDWQLASQIEKGRNEVLRMVAQNESLESILNTLCRKSQIYNAEMLCSVLRLDNQKKTLHPIASVALPEFYCEAIDGVEIGSGVGSCGTAAFSKKRVIVEDINTHPYWNQYKDLALQADLQACWSEPIIGPNGWVYGTFAMYYRTPKSPTEEDLNFIEVSANLAAVVFENHDNREKLLTANALLSNTIDKRNKKLKKVNEALTKALEEQNHLHHAEMKNEKMITANNLIAGFSHEISTPVGIALTAITTSEDKLSTLVEQFLTNTLTRTTFANKLRELEDIIGISKRSLLKTNDLMLRFKEASTSSCTDIKSAFSIRDFFDEFNTIAQNMLGDHQLSIHCDDIEIVSNKASLWQIFFNLVENSIVHGFANMEKGSIHINVVQEGDEININYQDNGCGLSEVKSSDIFEPFYTSARNKKRVGLGLNITNNLISHNLQGRIRLHSSPIGVRYEIKLPLVVDETLLCQDTDSPLSDKK